MAVTKQWVKRWGTLINLEPVYPGVWERKEGGHVVRARVTDPRTGRLVEIVKSLPGMTAAQSLVWLEERTEEIRRPPRKTEEPLGKISFAELATRYFEAAIARGKIRSEATKENFKSTLKNHLLVSSFAEIYLDALRRADFEEWIDSYVVPLINRGKISPNTANGWLRDIKSIVNWGVNKYEMARNPVAGLEPLDARGRKTVSAEQPNSLTPVELPVFLALLKQRWPQHYCFALLGFLTGLRPSHLRPLRVKEDVDLVNGCIYIHRSHTRKQAVMSATKTDEPQRIGLPEEVLDVIRWHIDRLPYRLQETGLLFPSSAKGMMTPTALYKPFADVTKAMGLQKKITPKGMRRTHKDLTRRAEISQRLREAISGHKTEAVERLYETVGIDETKAAIGKVLRLVVNNSKEVLGGPNSPLTSPPTRAANDDE